VQALCWFSITRYELRMPVLRAGHDSNLSATGTGRLAPPGIA
jgi:hypothetical protein